MKAFKKSITILGICGLLPMMTACSASTSTTPGNNASNTKGGAADNGGKVVEVSLWARDSLATLIDTPIKQFNSTHKDIQVKMTSIPSNSFAQQFTAAVSAKNMPDVVAIDDSQVPYFSSIGTFADMTKEFNSLDFKDQLIKSMMNVGQ